MSAHSQTAITAAAGSAVGALPAVAALGVAVAATAVAAAAATTCSCHNYLCRRHTSPSRQHPVAAPSATSSTRLPTKPKIIALVPMKHRSERVPGKNYRTLGAEPLAFWVMRTLLASPSITAVVVNTDSDALKQLLSSEFPTVIIVDRPPNLCGDDVPMNEILLHDTAMFSADVFLQTHATNPFLRTATIEAALKEFLQRYPRDCDSLFSVRQWQTRLYDSNCVALNHNSEELLRTQDLAPIFEENSCLYVFTREQLMVRRHRIGLRPHMLVMSAGLESTDIDTEEDFEIAEVVARRMQRTSTKSSTRN